MKRIIKETLLSVGLEVRRIERRTPLSFQAVHNVAGTVDDHIIEFVGLPGVGKTFLLKNVSRRLNNFFIQTDLCERTSPERIRVSDPAVSDLYKRLFEIRINDILYELAVQQDVRHNILRVGSLSKLLVKSLPLDCVHPIRILADEGFVKNYTQATVQLAREGHEGALKALSRRSLVLLVADPELQASQLLKRQGIRRPPLRWTSFDLLKGRSHSELSQHFQMLSARYVEWIEQLRPYARNVLVLSRDDSVDLNINAVLELACPTS